MLTPIISDQKNFYIMTRQIKIFISSFFFLANFAHAFKQDEIIQLPGWKGHLPSKQFSGYLNPTEASHLHYWFVEAEKSPRTAPVVVWFNGGPGCSSMDGFFYEHGPFEINPSNYSELFLRKTRWSSIVNALYIESPVGVGFSYSDNLDYELNDDRAADENRGAIEDFYSKFPQYIKNDLFITGESYAGIYVPTLAEAILQGEEDGSYHGAKLTGIAVGNGCVGTEVGICGFGPQGTFYEWKYLLQTAFIPSNLKDTINTFCDWKAAAANKKDALSEQCQSLLSVASSKIGEVNLYNVYGDCTFDTGCPAEDHYTPRGKIPLRSLTSTYTTATNNNKEEEDTKDSVMPRIILGGPDACIDSAAASSYLNNPLVMEAIHVRPPGFCWSVCQTVPGWSYVSTRKNLPAHTYPKLISKISVVIFNGDWDACVPYTDNEAWTEGMGFDAKSHWHPWTYTSLAGNSNQVAGYAVEYDVSTMGTGSFQFVTVKGGRHEVPESSPAQALELLRRLINKIPF
eukprot:gene4032-8027_t